MGILGGALKPLAAPALAAGLLRALSEDLDPATLDGVILGHAMPAGCGPDPAGAAVRQAGLPEGLPAFTVNQGAASGLRAVLQAAAALRAGEASLILAGGMDSSSSAPFLLPTARWGTRMGAAPILDALLMDGGDLPETGADPAALDWLLTRRARHQEALASGAFQAELVPTTFQARRGPVTLTEDEPLPAGSGWSTFGDGAALLLLASREGLGTRRPLACLKASGQGRSAVEALQRVLDASGLHLADIDRFEVEDGLPGPLADLLAQLPADRVNVHGGGLAMGRPLGATGARMGVALTHQLQAPHVRYGLVLMAGLALLLESP